MGENKVAFEVLKTLIRPPKGRKGLILLDAIFGNKSLTYRFGELHIQFESLGYGMGNVTLTGEQAFVIDLYFDLLKFKKLNYHSLQIKKRNGHSETRITIQQKME